MKLRAAKFYNYSKSFQTGYIGNELIMVEVKLYSLGMLRFACNIHNYIRHFNDYENILRIKNQYGS